jgi:serine protease DegQ
MLRRLWLIFAQTATVALAALFILATLRPEWLPARLGPPEAPSAATPGAGATPGAPGAAAKPGTPGVATAGNEHKDGPTTSYSDAARRAIPSVVNIFTTKDAKLPPNHPFLSDPLYKRFFGDPLSQRQQSSSSLGSGVIVGSDGIVITNYHVVDSADAIEVLLSDGRRTKAKVVGGDPETDVAVLRTELRDLPAVQFGDDDSAKVGDVVLAIGNPFGVGQTVTMGIVSALGRNQLGINTFENFIQTDAAINPGNSGGALVDAEGKLLGINTAIYSRSGGSLGIGFAIPVSTAKQVMEQIIATGAVTRGYIGVEPQDVTPELAEAFKLPRKDGAIIAGVMRGGPAEKAGVRVGDILVEVENKPVKNTASMLNLIAQISPATIANFKFLREGNEINLPITVGKRPKPNPKAE